MSSVVIAGDTSGSVTLQAPAVAGSTVLTLPSTSGTLITSAGFTLATPVALTSGSSVDFTGIPSGVKQINISLTGARISSGVSWYIQLGDSGGVETTGYVSSVSNLYSTSLSTNRYTNAFIISETGFSSHALNGLIICSLLDSSNNTWVYSSNIAIVDQNELKVAGGSKSLSAVLNTVRLTASSGTFVAGTVNISYI